MTTDLDRIRTDAIIALLKNEEFDQDLFLSNVDYDNLTKEDLATLLTMGAEPPEYKMKNLSAPMAVSQMVLPNYRDFVAGHTKVSHSPLTDFPMAEIDSKYGDHHPFGATSNSCPLIHGMAHGEPYLGDHLLQSMDKLSDIASKEKRIAFDKTFHGHPKETLHDLMTRDRNRHSLTSDEDYANGKLDEWRNRLGLLPFLFGLEYNTSEDREGFHDIIKKMSQTKGMEDPEFKILENKMSERANVSWGRVVRSWRERFSPMLHWWMRASDRHGPVTPSSLVQMMEGDFVKSDMPDEHFVSPYVADEMGINESLTHHWWDVYSSWGGVGRGLGSLKEILKQSYPDVFDGWLEDFLIDQNHQMLMKHENDGGSHFPMFANQNPAMASLRDTLSSDSFTKRRANWSHSSNLHFLHPSEVNGNGGRMIIPSDQLMMSRLGAALASQVDMGQPRIGMTREEHPSSTPVYWKAHNALYTANDMHLGQAIQNMATRVAKELGPDVLNPTDPEMADVARGNLQQVASAADFALKRMNMGDSYKALAPYFDQGGNVMMGIKELGPVHHSSHVTSPPVYNSGSTHLWGHEMPTNLTWKYDASNGGIVFGLSEDPFMIMQRTAHENHVKSVLPSLINSPVSAKKKDILALSALDQRGLSPIATGMIHKSDDYEPTGVFKTKIIPAHTISDLDDMNELKGFSGEWVVQKMPKGKRMFVEKKKNHLKNSKLPAKIKKQLREIKGDFTFDAYLEDDVLKVVDLLVHKGSDLHQEPLADRVNALRTLYDSTENVHFPMPTNCINSDEEGLAKTITSLGSDELLIRDSRSTFMKEKDVHPKWIRYVKSGITKCYPPFPELVVKQDMIRLEYPSIYDPVIIKGTFDGDGFDVESIEGLPHLVKTAVVQEPYWGSIAISLLKEGSAGGAVTSTTAGTHSPLHSSSKRKRPRKLKLLQKTIVRAAAIEGVSEEGDNVAKTMKLARHAITRDDTAKTTQYLLKNVKGLTTKMLDMFAGEYGLEKTENGKWTVNEAIDDDIIENMFPRMNRISPDGGAWSGMQADITAPRGPTELIDDSAVTFYDPKQGEQDDLEKPRILHLDVREQEGEDATLDVEDERAVLRYPKRTKKDILNEQEAVPATFADVED